MPAVPIPPRGSEESSVIWITVQRACVVTSCIGALADPHWWVRVWCVIAIVGGSAVEGARLEAGGHS